jgi:hypothetical protein
MTIGLTTLMALSGAVAAQAAQNQSVPQQTIQSNVNVTHPGLDCTDISLKHTADFAASCTHISRHAFLAPDMGSLSSAGGQGDNHAS